MYDVILNLCMLKIAETEIISVVIYVVILDICSEIIWGLCILSYDLHIKKIMLLITSLLFDTPNFYS